jgi:hypothetical protein
VSAARTIKRALVEPPRPTRREVTLADLAATRYDIAAFARLLGIEPHQGQERIWQQMMLRDGTRFRPYWLTICISAGNRAGKTLLVALGVLHHTVFKMGLAPPDDSDSTALDRFNRQPYDWYHFGLQQEVGELLFHAIIQVLEGTHDSQRKHGCPLVESFGPIETHEAKERGEYRWIRIDPLLGGGQIHFRTTAERGVGSLGKDMNGISFDECGFENNLEFVVDEVLHMRRLSTGGPMWLVSTPSEGFNAFQDVWKRGDPENPLQEPDRISFRMSSRDNIGHGIDPAVFERMVAGYPEHLVPQNVDGYFIQGRQAFFDSKAVDAMFVDSLPQMSPRERGHRYVQGVDPAVTYDATWSLTLDATDAGRATGVRAERRKGKQRVTDVAALVKGVHQSYNGDGATCETALDTTGMGGKVFKQMLDGVWPLRSVEFGGTRWRKKRMLTDLKALIEQGRLRFPRSGPWLELRRQLLGYIIEDRKIEQDAVMALAVAVKQIMRQMAGALDEAPFDFWGEGGEPVENPVIVKERERQRTQEELTAYRLKRAYPKSRLL